MAKGSPRTWNRPPSDVPASFPVARTIRSEYENLLFPWASRKRSRIFRPHVKASSACDGDTKNGPQTARTASPTEVTINPPVFLIVSWIAAKVESISVASVTGSMPSSGISKLTMSERKTVPIPEKGCGDVSCTGAALRIDFSERTIIEERVSETRLCYATTFVSNSRARYRHQL